MKNQLADVKEDQAAAQQRRQLLQQQLEAINAELDSINAQISYYDQEIAQKEAERREAEAKEQAQYELFCERVRAMEEEGTVSYWSILFNAENFSDMLDRLADIDAVMDYDNQVMEELTAARQELERLQAELESARAEEQAAKDQQGGQEGGATGQGGGGPEAAGPDQCRRGGAQPPTGRRDGGRGGDPGGDRPEAEATGGRSAGKTMSPSTRETNYLWPLPGYYRLTSLFGYRIHPITGKAHSHTGIDIPPLAAPHSGLQERTGGHLRLPLLLRQLRGHRPRQRQLHPLRPHELPGGEARGRWCPRARPSAMWAPPAAPRATTCTWRCGTTTPVWTRRASSPA